MTPRINAGACPSGSGRRTGQPSRDHSFLGPNFADDERGTQIRSVNRPAVRIGDRWVRRCPDLEVVAA